MLNDQAKVYASRGLVGAARDSDFLRFTKREVRDRENVRGDDFSITEVGTGVVTEARLARNRLKNTFVRLREKRHLARTRFLDRASTRARLSSHVRKRSTQERDCNDRRRFHRLAGFCSISRQNLLR